MFMCYRQVGILTMDYYFRESNCTDTVNASYLNKFDDPLVSHWVYIVKDSGTLFGSDLWGDELRVNNFECLGAIGRWEF